MEANVVDGSLRRQYTLHIRENGAEETERGAEGAE